MVLSQGKRCDAAAACHVYANASARTAQESHSALFCAVSISRAGRTLSKTENDLVVHQPTSQPLLDHWATVQG